ncbi:G-type lectin S-receptor-like serine/threonine-protein kinase At1g11330 [Neltuma alba]|uniref:G-type lectin S-receptor-like serine/threonine-protein kinase At1g11330 n=1 Tax=Neltuma alba TaxID=207710 RepID=UPI0010A59650|nr:G-type lectin S-receptor-like serine/threonine-protein kinase At1g11330 [Prosopis alba]
MFFMGFSRYICFLISFLIYLLSFALLVCALDIIEPSVLIHEPETLSSNISMFTLGFFSPKNSTNRYVGIWFLSESNVVWVANRNNPLRDSSGILTISENNGNLVVLDGQKQILWSTNVSSIASNSSAQLLDSGNLVLVDGITGSTVWQSFEHPCDTLLQDMKLSTNQHTGEKVRLTSWKSASDPSSGEFSCGLEPRNVTEIFVWKENHPYFRSGPWDGVNFLGIPRTISSNSQTGFQLKGEQGSFNLSFYSDKSLWSFTLNSQGKVEQRLWNSQTNAWDLRRIMYSSDCDVYGKCGPFGICDLQNSPICSCLRGFEPKNKEEWARQNWTNGCVRREALQCERDKNDSQASNIDGFFMVEKVKVPGEAQVLPSYVEDPEDCQISCLKNCSCKAYAHERNLGCMIWNTDLLDMQSLPDGVDVYIRLANSELCIYLN